MQVTEKAGEMVVVIVNFGPVPLASEGQLNEGKIKVEDKDRRRSVISSMANPSGLKDERKSLPPTCKGTRTFNEGLMQ